MTKRGINTQHSATIFSFSLPLTWLITRGETLALLISIFSSLLILPIPFLPWSERNYSKTFSNYNFLKFYSHRIKNILIHLKKCFCQFPIASHRNYSRTIPNYVFAIFQRCPLETLLSHFLLMSLTNFICISSEKFKLFSNFIFAKIQVHLSKIIPRHFQIMFLPRFPFFAYPIHTFATGVQTVSSNSTFAISVCGFRG